MMLAAAAALALGASNAELLAEIAALKMQNAALRRPKAEAAPAKLPGLEDAERCNNQGFYYADAAACLCFKCFSGPACASFDKTCVIDDGAGNPYLFEEYWRNTTGVSTEPLYYRSPYERQTALLQGEPGVQGELLSALNESIFAVHKRVNNIANVERKNVVVGSGGTELIGAVSYACKQLHGKPGETMYIYANAPFYSGYTGNLLALGVKGLEFTERTDLPPSQVIEFVTYPNNPTNEYRRSVYNNTAACTVHDQVYWWPHTADMTRGGAPLATSISLFSMSKLSGHAGTRLGWALVDDAKLASLMGDYISTVQIHVSVDAQRRTMDVLNYLTGTDDMRFFEWARAKFDERWAAVNALFENGQTRFKQHSDPHGFYAFVECLRPGERDNCMKVFHNALVGPSPGTSFGGSAAFVRLELVQPTAVFNIMVERLRPLVA